MTHSVQIPSLGDLLCTLGTFWRIVLYKYPTGWSKFYIQPFHELVCTLVTFITYFVYLYLLAGLIFHIVSLVTYSVHIPLLGDLFCTEGCFWRLILYTYIRMFDLFSKSTTSSCHRLYTSEFLAYFVYLLLLGELIFYMGDIFWLTRCASSSVHTSSLWPIVYIKNCLQLLLYTYLPIFPLILCSPATWLSLYSDIYGLFCSFSSPL